ncbi:hypothetical protein [Tenggerimyces flavus]|uniref:Uncharacterized protein n=1 Tax=Tenggerimyces flavus TaxID=1708749 RepID=A0ABV7Y7L2_9ACTN|nr:hypothetical protein [Tenggerimyces flavus]MBM7785707.1 hypothetical protein [Tenggerimyces flavus]
MLRIERFQPGELEGEIDPRDYGFEVIRQEPPSDRELAGELASLYARAKRRTGVTIPELEPLLPSEASGQGV